MLAKKFKVFKVFKKLIFKLKKKALKDEINQKIKF